MKTRDKLIVGFLLLCYFNIGQAFAQEKPERSVFEIKIYHLSSAAQEASIDQFLESAYIPAMHQKGVEHVGVFKPVETDSLSGKRIYVFTPYSNAQQFMNIASVLHLEEGLNYQNASHENPPFDRIETILLKAFSDMPHYAIPQLNGPKEERIYELRSYESPTEKLFHNKVEMFNSGEVEIFDRLGFNALFYGEVVVGDKMPNLMYMTSFENLEAEKAAWKSFGTDAGWVQLRDDPRFQNNVSHIDITLLHPASYSEL
ncbi:NIPSNAP family protein [Echinicola sp. CAU 1574]|uniref:NIPSNAP family protein n=1 Tax=Echinicola arenosa TaxID=2774144 RepID=A0ABR9AKB1_9BACT|nr:NIPSNAP family protein [Echinicola arenosa]MBD8489251.1 NIPSNAP family protein [Echinicola arenosa]